MKNIVAPNELDEKSPVALKELDAHPAYRNLEESSSHLSSFQDLPFNPSEMLVKPARSYQPYRWSLANSVLDFVDAKTQGRAGQVQRVFSYLFFGGTAALVNLAAYAIMLRFMSADDPIQNTIAYAVAAELSIMANFIPNDRFTFNTLPGAKRPWLQRCLRFQATCIVGTILTYLINMGLKFGAHMHPLIAEAIAIIIVLIYNFTAHNLFTYRKVKTAH